METEGIIFDRIVGKKGNSSKAITLPVELSNFLDIQEGDTIYLAGHTGKKGKYVTMWRV